jgi:hypothetical protein
MGTMFIKTSRKTKAEIAGPGGGGVKGDEREEFEREV